jgi:hypothetical protein
MDLTYFAICGFSFWRLSGVPHVSINVVKWHLEHVPAKQGNFSQKRHQEERMGINIYNVYSKASDRHR